RWNPPGACVDRILVSRSRSLHELRDDLGRWPAGRRSLFTRCVPGSFFTRQADKLFAKLWADFPDSILMNRKALAFRFFGSLIALTISVWPAYGQTLKARLDGDQVHLDAPDLHFISTDARQVLHDGSTLTYSFRISVSASKSSIAATSITYHCVFSYDIWEERYKVSRSEP